MSLFAWCTRRSGGLAMIALLVLCYWVISKESSATRHGYKYQQQDSLSASSSMTLPADHGAGYWTVAFAYYCLLIHVLVFMFPLRACWALWDITRSLKKTARSKALRDFKFAHRRRGSSTSLSSSETLTSSHGCSASSSEAGDLDADHYTDGDVAPDRVVHAVIIPNYKEEMDTLRETLEVLASHPQARNSYDVSGPLSLSLFSVEFFMRRRTQLSPPVASDATVRCILGSRHMHAPHPPSARHPGLENPPER